MGEGGLEGQEEEREEETEEEREEQGMPRKKDVGDLAKASWYKRT